ALVLVADRFSAGVCEEAVFGESEVSSGSDGVARDIVEQLHGRALEVAAGRIETDAEQRAVLHVDEMAGGQVSSGISSPNGLPFSGGQVEQAKIGVIGASRGRTAGGEEDQMTSAQHLRPSVKRLVLVRGIGEHYRSPTRHRN